MGRPLVKSGFTIVELLIVVVVIGILASVTVVSYNGIQTRAQNVSRLKEMKVFESLFTLYQTRNNAWPPALTVDGSITNFCLGTGFPVGAGGVARCRDIESTSTGYPQSGNTALMSELSTVGTIPTSPKVVVIDAVGPYATVSGENVVITGVFRGSSGQCPAGTSQQWYAAPYMLWCEIVLTP